ncbi:MAG: hypothetical protein RLZZ502_172 [Pseudomonadota bacterium]|jgi:uncharacterized RDD family membrane protein YckC
MDQVLLTPAPKLRRMGAYVHEAFFLTAFIFIVSLIFSKIIGSGIEAMPPMTRYAMQALLFLSIGTYFIYQWTSGRRTLAYKTWQLRLRNAKGEQLSRQQAIIRYVASWIGPMLAFFCYQFFGKTALFLLFLNVSFAWFSGRNLHDRVANTHIIFEPNTDKQ